MNPKRSATLLPITCLLMLLVANCALKKMSYHQNAIGENAKLQVQELKRFEQQIVVMPGQVTLLRFPYYGPFKSESLICNEQKVPFVSNKREAIAYLVLSYFDEVQDYSCIFKFDEEVQGEIYPITNQIKNIIVQKYPYPKEELHVDHKKVVFSKESSERVSKEREELDELFLQSSPSLLFNEPFSLPLDSKITSIFGTKRIFNNAIETEHLGTDFRAAIGTKIKATNTGKVVFVGDLFLGGKTVVIDHGLGIFTTYSHLSKLLAEVGQRVNKDTVIGFSGMTGRANGPHLHWGIKIHGHWVDGHSLISASKESFPVPRVETVEVEH